MKKFVFTILILCTAACAAVPVVQLGLDALISDLRHRASVERMYAALIYEAEPYFRGRAEGFETAANLVEQYSLTSSASSAPKVTAKAQPIPNTKR